MTKRVHNFYAGPSTLPLPALERAQKEFLDFAGAGMSVMEMSHRCKEYDAVHNEALALVRELLNVPKTHHIGLCQGGASLQFAQVPMNFLPKDKSADYVVTGVWAEKALKEAQMLGKVRVAGTSKDTNFNRLPEKLDLDPNAAYVHLTSNNTIYGTQYHQFPDVGKVPLVCDMSSDIMCRPIDVSKFAMIYAGAQKNMGPSGVVVVIIADEFLKRARTDIPTMLRYDVLIKENSLYNTCPTFGIYMLRNVLAHTKSIGGLAAMEKHNREKAAEVYAVVDQFPAFYKGNVAKQDRSWMNLTFRLPSEELEGKFDKEATKAGLIGLKGHRSAGGIRVSLYTAMTREGVKALVQFMKDFQAKNA
ncbi:MAG TPA: 3-phosphoserine/phosphohydroxythreonine transaminase [Planctomycetota bacterium]|nr:3-phosphoserine/phosphohydroxythreonine transaminase [Planctomycetota bacterium]